MKHIATIKKWDIVGFLRRHPAMFAGGLAAGMMVCIYAVWGIWPFGENTVITGDLNGQYIPYFSHYQRVFFGEAGFFYGLDKSLGGAFAALFSYYVASPLNVLYLFVPVAWFAALAGLLFALKVVLTASFMALYLNKKFKNLGLLGVVPALGYAFSAYVFVYAQNIMWHDVLLLFPVVCLALERLLNGKGVLLYSAALALMIWANFYIAFMACIFLVLYVLCFFIMQNRPKRFIMRSSLQFAGASLLGGGLAGALLIPTVYNLNSSKLDQMEYSFSPQTQFSLLHLPEQLAFNNFQWQNVVDGNPLLYCGLLLPLLAMCFFISRKIKLKAKLCAGAVLVFLAVSFWVDGLDDIWHGFAEPVWFPYRYSWLFCFVLAILAAAALSFGAVEKKTLFISSGISAGAFFVLVPISQSAGMVKLLLSAAGVFFYGACLWWMFKNKETKRWYNGVAVVLLFAVCTELCASGFLISRKFEQYSLPTYQTFINDVGGTMQSLQEESPQYRVEKNFYRTLNDPMLLNYHGNSHFGSTQDKATTETLWNLGYRGIGSYLYGSTAFSDSVLSFKSLLATDERAVPAHWQEESDLQVGTVYTNPYALPLVFAAPLTDNQAEAVLWEDSFAYQNELYRAITGSEENLLLPAEQVHKEENGNVLDGVLGVLPQGGEYVLTPQESGYYYALFIADNPYADLEYWLDGEMAGAVFTSDQNGVINLGYRQAGEEVRLGFGAESTPNIQAAYFAYLQEESLLQLTQQANENSGNFLVEDARVEGEITVGADRQALFIALPYDEGWSALVNGIETKPFMVQGGLMGLALQEGENEVIMTYSPPGVMMGVCASAISLVVFLGIALWQKRKKMVAAETINSNEHSSAETET